MQQGRQVGDWIAERYEVFDIHTGGMGLVFVVYDHQGASGQRVLAIKTLRDEFLRDRKSIARFTTECGAWIKLDRHPNIVRAYSVQEIEGKPHAVLELVTGGDLRRWIGTPRLDLRQVLRFAVQFCLGMEHAMHKGLHCHRDIKPENLLVSEGGTLKITDFGLAKVKDEVPPSDHAYAAEPIPLADSNEVLLARHKIVATTPSPPQAPSPFPPEDPGWGDFAAQPAETIDLPAVPGGAADAKVGNRLPTASWAPSGMAFATGLESRTEVLALSAESLGGDRGVTRDGVMLGTGPYMAPEQFRDAKVVDFRADIYSFGVVLFEMIAGERPFAAETFAKLAKLHERAAPPSILRHIPGKHARVAKPIDRIVQRCLAKAPNKRFGSYPELRRALAKCLWKVAREALSPPTEVELEAWELTNKGASLGTLGRHDEERACYEGAIRVMPAYVPSWFNQAAAAASQGHPEEALDFAEVALHLNPSSVPALINKALALDALRRTDESLRLLDVAARLQPHDPEVWYGRGFVLLARGNFEGAKSALTQVLRLRPTYPEALYALGVVLSRIAAWSEAERYFQAAGDRSSARAMADYRDHGTLPRLQTVPWVRRTEDTPAPAATE